PRDKDNPHGEDFLTIKIEQVRWLVAGLKIRWHLIAVDDGCPAEPPSAEVAKQILQTRDPADEDQNGRVTVLNLQEVVEGRIEASVSVLLSNKLSGLGSTGESRKGGSILYGLAHALACRRSSDSHVVLYTDADLSANLAQAGLLAAPILSGKAKAVAGQRYGVKDAVLVKDDRVSHEPESTTSKPDSTIVLLRQYFRSRLLPDIADIADTQAGFKAFSASALRTVIKEVASLDESFDVELLVRFTQRFSGRRARPIVLAPIVFVEDFGLTNFPSVGPQQRHLDMINQLVSLHCRLMPNSQSETSDVRKLVGWLQQLSLPGYVAIVEYLERTGRIGLRVNRTDSTRPLFDPDWSVAELQAAARTTVRTKDDQPKVVSVDWRPVALSSCSSYLRSTGDLASYWQKSQQASVI
ncbi:MAG: hypothetical protein AAGA65_23095, partial [Actinomycetota bacterium]